jgi:hypothetical protein
MGYRVIAMKQVVKAVEILRYAQDDKKKLMMTERRKFTC